MEIRGGVVPRLALPHRAPTPGYKRIDALPKTIIKMWSSPPPNSKILPIRESSNSGGMTHKTTVAKTAKVGSLTMTGTQTVKKEKSPVKLSALKRTKVPVFRGKDSKNGPGEGEASVLLARTLPPKAPPSPSLPAEETNLSGHHFPDDGKRPSTRGGGLPPQRPSTSMSLRDRAYLRSSAGGGGQTGRVGKIKKPPLRPVSEMGTHSGVPPPWNPSSAAKDVEVEQKTGRRVKTVKAAQMIGAASGPKGDLWEANEKLRRENEELRRQLELASLGGTDDEGAQHLSRGIFSRGANLAPLGGIGDEGAHSRGLLMSRAQTRGVLSRAGTRGGGWAGGDDEADDIVFIEGRQRPPDERIEELKREIAMHREREALLAQELSNAASQMTDRGNDGAEPPKTGASRLGPMTDRGDDGGLKTAPRFGPAASRGVNGTGFIKPLVGLTGGLRSPFIPDSPVLGEGGTVWGEKRTETEVGRVFGRAGANFQSTVMQDKQIGESPQESPK